MVFNAALMPVVLMLMFVYMFGNAFNVGGNTSTTRRRA